MPSLARLVNSRTLVCSTLLLAFPVSAAERLDNKPTDALQPVIRGVRAGEELFRNVELRYLEKYELLTSPPVTTDPRITMLLRYEIEQRLIVQDGLYYYTSNNRSETPKGPEESTYRFGYDGSVIRSVKSHTLTERPGEVQKNANIRSGELPNLGGIVRTPHTLAHSLGKSTLSEWFDHSYIDKYHKGADFTSETVIEGEEEINGISCVRVAHITKGIGAERERTSKRVAWLASDRHYVPAKSAMYERVAARHPVSVALASDWREVEAGVLVPFKVVTTAYTNETLDNARPTPKFRTTITVLSVSLNPKYDVSLFRDIPISAGTLVHVVNNGKIVESYIQQTDLPVPSSSRRLALVIIASVLLIIGALVGYKWYRARTRSAKAAIVS